MAPQNLASRLVETLHREALVCLVVGAPALAYVLVTNHTASRGVILLHAGLLGALAPFTVAALELSVPRASRPGWRSVVRGLAVRTVGLGLSVAAMLAVLVLLTPLSLQVLVGGPLLVGLLPVFLAYALVALAAQWAELRAHALRVEVNEARARQAALAARIRPHFLFNALNVIEELTDTEPKAAREAVGRLSRLLRSVLEASARPKNPLVEEVRRVEDYLGLERVRFGARLTYALRLPPELVAEEVPSTVLLTLVENAVKHGVETVRGPVSVEVQVRKEPDALVIVVLGPAPGGPPAREGAGYGLADVRERLELAYGGRASLSLTTSEGVSRVEVVLPG